MRDLSTLSTQELEDFFNSFDIVLSDIDGVLWNVLQSIPGAPDGISSLKKLNKQVILITNNTVRSVSALYKKLKDAGFDIEESNLVTPAQAMVSYLRKKNLTDKKIYVIGMTPLKELLKGAGFEIVETLTERIEESVETFASLTTIDDEDVGVVIADSDFNRNVVKMQKAVTFLQRKDVVFLSGATDKNVPLGKGYISIGPGYYLKIFENMTGRKPIALAKPSSSLNEYVVDEFKIKDLSRVLFIGDSIPEDMGFAANCGYKKLLVLSGLSKKNSLEKWEFPEKYKPEFYVESLKIVHELIVKMNEILLGPGIFIKILEGMSKRTAIKMAKPSPSLNEYIVEKYGIKDSSRVLFIGDSIPEDMGFAGNCGYKKLLGLSSLTKRSSLEDWKFEEKCKPDFYVESLKQVHELALRLGGKKL